MHKVLLVYGIIYRIFSYFSYSSLFLLLVLLILRSDIANCKTYKLVLDSQKSPPASIPTDPRNLIYSVPLNQLTSRPIVAYIKDSANETVHSLNNIKAYATTMDKNQKNSADSDSWRDSGGMLCQWTNPDEDWPARLNRDLYRTTCGSSLRATTLIGNVFKGKIILDWLMHVHPNQTLPGNNRFIRIEIPDLKLSTDTNIFEISEQASTLKITKQPPRNITTNTGFDITAEILDRKGDPLTVGLDSVAFVDLTVSYNQKMFKKFFETELILRNSSVRLAGPSVTTYKATGDLVIRQRASAGKVSFTDVRILDAISDLRLNLTMFMSNDPFARIPNCEKCYSDLEYTHTLGKIVTFKIPPASVLKDLPSMAFTNSINIVPQVLAKLRFISNYVGTGKMAITRNFPIPGPLTIHIEDKNGNRIVSGTDSKLVLGVETIPGNVCLSNDSVMLASEGVATFTGSICEIKSSVFLVFYTKRNPSVSVRSQEMSVDGNVEIAHFDHFKFTGIKKNTSPYVNSFIHFAANDLNNDVITGVLTPFNMTLSITTVETDDRIEQAVRKYKIIREQAQHSPNRTIRVAILSGNSRVSATIVGQLYNQRTPHISLDEKSERFTDYMMFNRVCWNWEQIYKYFIHLCVTSYWTRLAVLKNSNADAMYSLKYYARNHAIDITEVEIYDNKIPWMTDDSKALELVCNAIRELKAAEVKIIVCLIDYMKVPIILRMAYEQGLSSRHGFQWIFIGESAWAFPFKNTYAYDLFPELAKYYGGAILFTDAYNTTFMHTKDWERVLRYYFKGDRSFRLGLQTVYPDEDTSARMALGYDAIVLYARALKNIVSEGATATTEHITDELRHIEIEGLSGILKLDKYGNRKRFRANIRIIIADRHNETMDTAAPLYKHIINASNQHSEYIYEGYESIPYKNLTILSTELPLSPMYNIRVFMSMSGRLSTDNFQFLEHNESRYPEVVHRMERTVPPFTCEISCGNLSSLYNVNSFESGTCESHNKCNCADGFFGKYCRKIICNCKYGKCKIPYKCKCFAGYTGLQCTVPICDGGCHNGRCVKPNKCNCFHRFWISKTCDTHMTDLMVPLTINVILFIYLGYIFFIFLRRRIERTAVFFNVDWIVDWQDLKQVPKDAALLNSMAFRKSGNVLPYDIYCWNKRNWFLRKINSNTINPNDVNVRLEMVELIRLNHQNLITYGGACIVYPNVCLLVEIAQKGSLNEVLLNDTIQLDWNFRSSFLKDICRGMNFLHTKTKIGSHGRLKSSNCLLDNRWCIRISGFGAPTIRYGPNLAEKSETEKADQYYAMQEELLWTAPELLETASCLNDVKMGTKEGDVYSFGIIASEIATRNLPFAYERCYLSTCTLIDLIVNRDDPLMSADLEIWQSLEKDGNLVRPYIHNDYLTGTAMEKLKFKKMLNGVWANNPRARMTFQRIAMALENLFPVREELMDNLMHMLESYSKNLEAVVLERTDALEAEKTKVENIVSQMLPKSVIEELKYGNKVEPEQFECVTVYYSDIVGFTTLAKNMQPMHVVDLLNDLYILFDSILAKYDVYKVETIGDAYVVSSGVPIPNNNLHAGEIATASLDMMSALMMMESPQLTNCKLQLRIGINTGPVVAGVVGITMPRYTLFGETMQIASTMESSSKPMHIQVSEYTVKILNQLGGYFTKYRRNMTVCGENIDTYFLIGKSNYGKPLPDFVEDENPTK